MADAEPLISVNQIQQTTIPRRVISASVGASSAQVLAANLARQGRLLFANMSDETIYISPTGTAASSGGGSIPIVPGQTFTLEAPITCGFNAISSGGSSKALTIWEF